MSSLRRELEFLSTIFWWHV